MGFESIIPQIAEIVVCPTVTACCIFSRGTEQVKIGDDKTTAIHS